MEEALARTRGIPRSYLLPSPAQRLEDAQLTFKPRITQRSEVGPPGSVPSACLVSWACSTFEEPTYFQAPSHAAH